MVSGFRPTTIPPPTPQLTVWLNEFYPALASAGEDYFQTWNPLTEPAPDALIKTVYFRRAVHTRKSEGHQKAIADLQGKGGVYYAGAYCVFGMGLLEQAATSGRRVAELILEKARHQLGPRGGRGGAKGG